MKKVFVSGLAAVTVACCLVPKISTTHPAGYQKLRTMVTRCENASAYDYLACSKSAEMLEATDARRATAIFIQAWEQSAFGDFYKSVQGDRLRQDPVGLIGDSNSLAKSIRGFREICIPVLERIYQQARDPYSAAMTPQLELIIPDSESSLQAFRAAHVAAITNPANIGVAQAPMIPGVAPSAATPTPMPVATAASSASSGPVQVVHLKDGTVLRGEILSTANGVYTVKTALGSLQVPADSIDRIEFAPSAPAATPTPGAVLVPIATPTAIVPAATPAETPAVAVVAPATPAPTPAVAETPRNPWYAPTVVADPGLPPEPALDTREGSRFGLSAAGGYHQYSGWHWKNARAAGYSAPALELGGLARITEFGPVRLDGVATAGYYAGSHCVPDSATTCVTNSFTNIFVDVGPRVSWSAARAVVLYGEAGPGFHSSMFSWKAPANDPSFANPAGGHGNSSASGLSGHVVLGAGYDIQNVRLFTQLKYIQADMKFPGKSGTNGFFSYAVPLGMGGEMILVGAELRL